MWRRTGGSAFCFALFFFTLFALAMACLSSREYGYRLFRYFTTSAAALPPFLAWVIREIP